MVIKYCSNFYYICSNLLMLLFNLMKFAAIVFFTLFSWFCSNNENCSFTCNCICPRTSDLFLTQSFLNQTVLDQTFDGPNIFQPQFFFTQNWFWPICFTQNLFLRLEIKPCNFNGFWHNWSPGWDNIFHFLALVTHDFLHLNFKYYISTFVGGGRCQT